VGVQKTFKTGGYWSPNVRGRSLTIACVGSPFGSPKIQSPDDLCRSLIPPCAGSQRSGYRADGFAFSRGECLAEEVGCVAALRVCLSRFLLFNELVEAWVTNIAQALTPRRTPAG
jgi:hypothetical protein